MNRVVTVKPTDPSIPIMVARDHLRLDDDSSDAIVSGAIQGAASFIQNRTQRTLITTIYELSLNDWLPQIFLKLPPLVTVDSVKYDDVDGNEQTLSASLYEVGTEIEIPFIKIKPNQSFPSLDESVTLNRVRVTYTAGYGGPEDIPEDIHNALLLIIGDLYENREAVSQGSVYQANPTVSNLIQPYRVDLGV